jgi:hypothetical protein
MIYSVKTSRFEQLYNHLHDIGIDLLPFNNQVPRVLLHVFCNLWFDRFMYAWVSFELKY